MTNSRTPDRCPYGRIMSQQRRELQGTVRYHQRDEAVSRLVPRFNVLLVKWSFSSRFSFVLAVLD